MRKSILTILAILAVNLLWAQDPQFSQFYANPIYLNPAFAGTAQGPRVAMNMRNQWPSISSNYITYATSYDQHFDGIGGGIGLQAWYDRAGDGDLATTAFSGIYSYHLNVSEEFTIKAGLQATFIQRQIDADKLRFGDQIHAQRGFIYETMEPIVQNGGIVRADPIVDFSTGILGFTEQFFAGVAIHHITRPTQSFYGTPQGILPVKFTGHAGMMIPLEEARHPTQFISPNILYMRQADFSQVNFGAYVIKGPLIAGAWFRQTPPNSDALMLLVGLKKDILKVGYSYDFTVSEARSAAKGSHEISVILEFKKYNKSQTRKWRDVSCPDF